MGYFTSAEIKKIKTALSGVSKVGINIESYDSVDEQRQAFFNKAKLWRVIERIISALYIERLAEREMFLHDNDGNDYVVIRKDEYKDLMGRKK
ncbi:MAG: hypothetical protein ABIE47_03935 [Pseudomonadota bacterium]